MSDLARPDDNILDRLASIARTEAARSRVEPRTTSDVAFLLDMIVHLDPDGLGAVIEKARQP